MPHSFVHELLAGETVEYHVLGFEQNNNEWVVENTGRRIKHSHVVVSVDNVVQNGVIRTILDLQPVHVLLERFLPVDRLIKELLLGSIVSKSTISQFVFLLTVIWFYLYKDKAIGEGVEAN